MSKRTTKAERVAHEAKNQERFEFMQEWMATIDLDVWDVSPHAVVLDGYLLGFFLTRRADGYSILGTGPAAIANLPTPEAAATRQSNRNNRTAKYTQKEMVFP